MFFLAIVSGLNAVSRAEPTADQRPKPNAEQHIGQQIGQQIEQRVDQIMSQLTQEEKIKLLHGVDNFYTADIPRLGIPRVKMTDGPVGTRNDGPSTGYPAGALLAATWDPAIAEREGVALGRDARSRGDHILLGPGVNIYRQPQNGRNFEYLGEDPFLAGQIDVGYIKGVQSQGVSACVKHYDANNQEIRRNDVDVRVDERALHEIYLPAFEAAVREGHVGSIMASYNKINGDYATANHFLLTDVLRTEWGFDGLTMSDWGAVHDCLGPMTAGLDLEMPDHDFFNPRQIGDLLAAKKITQALIDEKVRHLIHLEVAMGWLDRPQKDDMIARDDAANDATALAVAREGIVLLKNDGALLPLDRDKVKNVVVMGPGADRYIHGGGSSETTPTRKTTILQGLQAASPNVNFTLIRFDDWQDKNLDKLVKATAFAPGAEGHGPLSVSFFNNPDLQGEPVAVKEDGAINYNWRQKLPVTGVTSHAFSARWTGAIEPAESGQYRFITRSDDGSRVLLDGKQIVDNWRNQAAHTEFALVQLEAHHRYNLTVEYYNAMGDASMQFAYQLAPPPLSTEEKQTIAGADAVLVCVNTRESEGDDRPYAMSGEQEDLIRTASSANPHTVVILEAGGNVAMKSWIDGVPALVDAWYPGQAGGRAIAEVLFGDINPSGHLPDTFEKDWPDSPAFGHYPGTDHVDYVEGIYVGYRWYDKKKIEPRFPFGFGLSYTSFDMKNLKVESAAGTDAFTASLDVTNTGQKPGATVAQLYVRPPANAAVDRVDRPVQELKGFARVDLKPGETQHITIPLNARSFAHWDVATHSWKVIPGTYEIAIGRSSRDIATVATVEVK
jgi:beta-glucosidase